MTKIFPVSKLFPFTTIHSFLLRYITLSQVNWLRNSKWSKFSEENRIPTILLKLIWSLPWHICFLFHDWFQQPTFRAFLKKCITFSWVNCLRNGETLKWSNIYGGPCKYHLPFWKDFHFCWPPSTRFYFFWHLNLNFQKGVLNGLVGNSNRKK